MRDGDCAEAILLPSLVAALDYIKTRGTLPVSRSIYPEARSNFCQPEFESVEDHSSVSKPLVSDSTTAELKARVKKFSDDIPSLAQASLNLCLFEGFLLYGNSVSAIHDYMDIKLFMQVSYKSSKARREARPPYVTRDGIWQDPPGYFDKIVWSNYVAEHQWMFEAGDVDGKLEKDILSKARIEAQIDKDADMDMETTLRWAVETLTREIAKLVME